MCARVCACVRGCVRVGRIFFAGLSLIILESLAGRALFVSLQSFLM